MTTVYLVRHGHTANNKSLSYNGCLSNQPLNELGQKQAEALTEAFAELPLDAIYSSPLRRAMMTAEGVRGTRDMAIEEVYDLREMDMGDLDGVTFAEVREKHPDIWYNWHDDPEKLLMPNGESFFDVRARGAAAIAKLVRRNRGKSIAIVAHSTLFCLSMTRFLGLTLHDRYRLPYLTNAAYHTLLIEDDGSFRVAKFGEVGHLENGLLAHANPWGNAAEFAGTFVYEDFAGV